ncbi:MAG: AAA family ATPase [Ruminococcus sp.]|nr:AAA family ATPase [Ruminococcus sp.]
MQGENPTYYDIVELFNSDPQKVRAYLNSNEINGNKKKREKKEQNAKAIEPEHWYDKDIRGLDQDGIDRLKQLESDVRRGSSHVDRKQIMYLKTLKDLQLEVPPIFKQDLSPKELYKKLKSFCDQNDIPTESIKTLLPSLLEWKETGYMRPCILVGPPGCGKTTCFRKLFEECLQIPLETIKCPQSATSHGIYGDAGTYQSASCGCLANGRIKHKSLIIAFLFDEIDKCSSGSNRISISDELLSVNDDSVKDFTDTYLEVKLPGLQHSFFCYTANNLEKINSILLDRCTVINFPPADSIRIKNICRKYVEKKLSTSLYNNVDWDYKLMNESIDNLVDRGVTSLRKHQQLCENVLETALDEIFNNPDSDEKIQVTRDMFETAAVEILGITNKKRKVGFG